MPDVKTNAMRILEQQKIPYFAHSYPHGKEPPDGAEVARLLGQDPDKVYKTLVTKGGNEYFVFEVPVLKELDLKKAARAVGAKSVEMLHVKDINKVTGYIRGGCSPIGMKKQYRTVFAQECTLLDTIIVSAGKVGFQIEASPHDLVKAVGGIIADITL